MRNASRVILGVLTMLAALHFVHAYEMRGVPNDFGQCVASDPPA